MRHLTLYVLMILCLRASIVIGQNHYNVDIFDFAKAKDPNTLPLPSPANLLANSIVEQVLELKPQSVTVRSPKDAGTILVKNTFYYIRIQSFVTMIHPSYQGDDRCCRVMFDQVDDLIDEGSADHRFISLNIYYPIYFMP